MPGLTPPGALSGEAEAFLASLRARGRADSTVAAYRLDLAAYERFLASRHLSVLAAREGDVASYAAGLTAAGRRPSSVARALVAVRALHRWCGSDAARGVGGPGLVPVGGTVLTEAEVVALLEAAGGTGAGAVDRRDRALLEMLYATGARISEVVGLSLGDVGGKLARIGGRSARIVPYGEHAADAVDAWLGRGGRATMAGGRAGSAGAALFVNQRGGRLSRQWGWAVVRAAADRVGLGERLGPHVVRRSFAVHLAARGAPPGVVRQLLVGRPPALGPEELAEGYRRWHPRAGHGASPGGAGSY